MLKGMYIQAFRLDGHGVMRHSKLVIVGHEKKRKRK